jgi:hypothetical protein
LLDGLKAQKFTGTLQFFDINTSGTLADLAQIRADLAIIVPAQQGLAGGAGDRRPHELPRCPGAVQWRGRRAGGQLHKIARREGMHLLGPNSGHTAPIAAAQRQRRDRWRRRDRWHCVSRARSPRPSWTGPATTAWAFPA